MSEVKTTQGLKMRGYLDLTNLPKSQVKKVKFGDGKEHLIVNIAIFETEPSYNNEGKMTSDHYITCAPKKDERIEGQKYGIGVENTIIRLCLYYGDSFRFTLESHAGSGLRIVLSADTQKEEYHETYESADSGR
jgi:hypothetical protein